MSTHHQTAEEFFESINGFDEIAISKSFGKNVITLANENDQLTFARALIFIAKRREGLSDTDAKDAALGLTIGAVNGFFALDEEAMPEDPSTEMGKGD